MVFDRFYPQGETARRRLSGVLVISAALLLGGCAVTTDPITKQERADQIATDSQSMFANQEPLQGPLTLGEAMARTMKYNLDHRLKMMEEALAQNQLDLSQYDLLPKLTAAAGYAGRSNQSASSSRSVTTQKQSLEPSTSQDRDRITTDLGLSWNILDFGVSYFNARQNSDRALIAAERRRKMVLTLTQEVRASFWKAVAAQKLQAQIAWTIEEAEQALANSRQVEAEGLRSPLDSLRYQKNVLEILRQLEAMQQELTIGKTELAALINVPPGTDFTLAVPGTDTVPHLSMPIEEMERLALLNNPDLMEQSYLQRISVDDTRKALLRLLPGIGLSASRNYDSNSFLVNNYWNEASARVTYNLINLLSAPATIEYSETNEKLTETRRLALSMAILSQVHIAHQAYLGAEKQFERAKVLDTVDHRIYEHVANRQRQDAQSQLEQVSAATAAIMAELRRYQAYSQMQGALGRIYATLGVDPLPEKVSAHDIPALKQAFDESLRQFDSGEIEAALRAVPAAPGQADHEPGNDVEKAPIAASPAAKPEEGDMWGAMTTFFKSLTQAEDKDNNAVVASK